MNSVKPMKTEREIYDIIAETKRTSGKYEILLHLGIFTGLRVSDILRLRVRDISRYPIDITEKKTQKKRRIEFDNDMCARLDEHITKNALGNNDYLIFSTEKNKNKPLSRIQAYRILKRAGERAGVEGIGTHSMRKTFAVAHFREHHDIEQLQRLLNHKYVHTTLRYLFNLDDFNRLNI